jgi:hypothetical protein
VGGDSDGSSFGRNICSFGGEDANISGIEYHWVQFLEAILLYRMDFGYRWMGLS